MALVLGLIAALSWGIHDILVRWVSQKSNVLSALFFVLLTGLVFQSAMVLARGDFISIPTQAWLTSTLAGIAFLFAGISLYKAFEIGPVQLVAPIIATFSILSIIWGMIQGNPQTIWQLLAVAAVFGGLFVVVSLANSDDTGAVTTKRTHAIGWAALAAIGFALTFGLGHSTVRIAPEMMTILITRFVAALCLAGLMMVLRVPLLDARREWKILTVMGALDALALACVLSAGNLPNASYASLASSLFGMVTIVLAALFLRERMAVLQWVGVCIIFAGIGYLAI